MLGDSVAPIFDDGLAKLQDLRERNGFPPPGIPEIGTSVLVDPPQFGNGIGEANYGAIHH